MPKSSNKNNLEKQAVFFNKPQRMAMHILANQEYHVWARRAGKSHGLTGPRSMLNAFSMPKSYGAFLVPSYKMGLTQTLPSTLAAWHFLGLRENVHFVINRKPPDRWNWPKPFMEPRNYENLIYFYNGSIAVLISQDRLGSSNSRSLDWLIVDEAKFINYDRLKTETIPALSGSIGTIREYNKHPRFKSALYCTDMPTLKKAQWIFRFKDEMDQDLINFILQIKRKQAQSNSVIVKNRLQGYLNELRADSLYYSEADIFDNIKVVGERYVRDQKRALPPLEFQTSILNIRPTKVPNGFYGALGDDHYYVSSNNQYLEKHGFNLKKKLDQDCRLDGDLDITKPLSLAFDFNAQINWLACGQADNRILRTVKSFYVKSPRRLKELCHDFSDYYKFFPRKQVDFYYDSTALKGNYAVSDEDFSDVITEQLEEAGWSVNRIYIGKPMRHDLKHLYIHQALTGQKYTLPYFNNENNEQLIFAMEQTGIKIGPKGYQKDKDREKLDDKPEDPLELRTDSTDAWDTLFIGINFFGSGATAGGSLGSDFI